MSLYGVVDGLFIGNMVGDVGLAAINIAWPIAAFIIAVGCGIGIGGSVLIGNKRGQGEEEASYEIFYITFTLLLIVSIGLTIGLLWSYPTLLNLFGAEGFVYLQATYYLEIVIVGVVFQVFSAGLVPILRNYGLPMETMVCMSTGTIFNIIINYIFVCVMDMGMRGTALGTVISQCLVAFLVLYTMIRKLEVYPKLRFEKKVATHIFRIGVTGFGISFAPSICLIFTNLQCLKYGGDEAVACYAVIAYIVFPVQALLTGIGEGTQPLISFYNGAQKHDLLKEAMQISYKIVLVIALLLTVLILVCMPYLGNLFGLSEGGQVYFENGMRCYAYSFILVGFLRFILCYLNATMQTRKATLLTYLESLVIAPSLLFFLPLIWGLEGVWISYPLTAILMLIFTRMKKMR